eukprot:1715653-Amphidinium_carterae.1
MGPSQDLLLTYHAVHNIVRWSVRECVLDCSALLQVSLQLFLKANGFGQKGPHDGEGGDVLVKLEDATGSASMPWAKFEAQSSACSLHCMKAIRGIVNAALAAPAVQEHHSHLGFDGRTIACG